MGRIITDSCINIKKKVDFLHWSTLDWIFLNLGWVDLNLFESWSITQHLENGNQYISRLIAQLHSQKICINLVFRFTHYNKYVLTLLCILILLFYLSLEPEIRRKKRKFLLKKSLVLVFHFCIRSIENFHRLLNLFFSWHI